jgi:hypothetical protein
MSTIINLYGNRQPNKATGRTEWFLEALKAASWEIQPSSGWGQGYHNAHLGGNSQCIKGGGEVSKQAFGKQEQHCRMPQSSVLD